MVFKGKVKVVLAETFLFNEDGIRSAHFMSQNGHAVLPIPNKSRRENQEKTLRQVPE
ncbi:hypothetical protein [Paenibacillus macquariensis]|uniref:hypothetical protein n=1 Tax=Paenibacillus macquariensis TaxID=948756 RepID=UPI000A48CA31|nr:hypothetical protein [Paenibacillus macquariensis]MEC0091228.1 hypothetical protein [Paenibacillus macquariensis]